MSMRSSGTEPHTVRDSLLLWNMAAHRYASGQSADFVFHRSVWMPAVDTLIGDVRHKDVLDLGCGNGYYAKKLACAGARVIGADGSTEMIKLARRDNVHPGISYVAMDLTRPFPIAGRSQDLVVANMVLMDLPHIDTCVSEVSRVIRDRGLFVFSLTHPAFFCSDWAGDASNTRAYKMIRDYLHEKTESLDFWGEIYHYHRPLSAYFRVLERSGLCVHALEEPVPQVGPEETDPTLLCHQRVPSFLVIKARPVNGI